MGGYSDRRDENEPEIIEHLKALGYVPQPIQAPAIGDLLVQFRIDGAGDGIMFCGCLEVKHPVTGRLTPSQAVYKPAAESLGILYEVVTTPEEAEAAVKQWRKAICEFFAARSKQPKKRKAKR